MEERSVQIFIPEKKNGLWGGDPFYLKFFCNPVPVEANFEQILAHSASSVTPSKKGYRLYRTVLNPVACLKG